MVYRRLVLVRWVGVWRWAWYDTTVGVVLRGWVGGKKNSQTSSVAEGREVSLCVGQTSIPPPLPGSWPQPGLDPPFRVLTPSGNTSRLRYIIHPTFRFGVDDSPFVPLKAGWTDKLLPGSTRPRAPSAGRLGEAWRGANTLRLPPDIESLGAPSRA